MAQATVSGLESSIGKRKHAPSIATLHRSGKIGGTGAIMPASYPSGSEPGVSGLRNLTTTLCRSNHSNDADSCRPSPALVRTVGDIRD